MKERFILLFYNKKSSIFSGVIYYKRLQSLFEKPVLEGVLQSCLPFLCVPNLKYLYIGSCLIVASEFHFPNWDV